MSWGARGIIPSHLVQNCTVYSLYSQLFTRMIADRAPAVKSLQETGEEVLKSADEDTKARIQEGLENVSRQWEELNDMTDTRKKSLDVTMEASVRFDGLLADANKKLAAVEEKLQAQQLGQKAESEYIQEEAKKLQVGLVIIHNSMLNLRIVYECYCFQQMTELFFKSTQIF